MKRYADKIKESKQIKEAFPPKKIAWNIYNIFSKIPELIKDIPSDSLVYFEDSNRGARSKVIADEDFRGVLFVISPSKKTLLELEVSTAHKNYTAISHRSIYSFKDIKSDLEDKG